MVGIHIAVGLCLIGLNLAAGLTGGIAWFRKRPSIPFWYLLRGAQVSVFVQALLGGLLVVTGHEPKEQLHYLYGILPLFVSFIAEGARFGAAERELGDVDHYDVLLRFCRSRSSRSSAESAMTVPGRNTAAARICPAWTPCRVKLA